MAVINVIPKSHQQPKPAKPPERWIPGTSLTCSRPTRYRLAKKLKPIGMAKQFGKEIHFNPKAPEIKPYLPAGSGKATNPALMLAEDLSPYSAKQIKAAQRWVEILESAPPVIAEKMSEGMGRVDAVEFFCRCHCPIQFGMQIAPRTFHKRDRRLRESNGARVTSQIDTRGRKPDAGETCSPEAWDYFLGQYLDQRQRRIMLCWELTVHESRRQGWAWMPYRTCCKKLQNEVTYGTKVLLREGKQAHLTKCTPYIERDWSNVNANDEWVGDEHTLDIYCRVPDGKDGWQKTRPKLTAWLDERSRMFVGWWISDKANTDTILASFRHGVMQFGPPLTVHIDNGKDYKSASGRSKQWANKERCTNVFDTLKIECHWSIPYHPQSKKIERHFREVKERFCKLFYSFCGGKPSEKPEYVEKIPVEKLPTIAEIRTAFAEWLEAHHARPQAGSGMNGLSPAQAMEQFASPHVRKVSPELLNFLCMKFSEPRKVSKNGVSVMGIKYGQGQPEVLQLQGKTAILGIPPIDAGYVWLCDPRNGRPICKAINRRLTGTDASREDVREGMRRQKRAKKADKEAADTRMDLRRTPVELTIEAQKSFNRSQQRTDLPEPAEPISYQAALPDWEGEIRRYNDESNRHRWENEAASIEPIQIDSILSSAILGAERSTDDADEQEKPPALDAEALVSAGALHSADQCEEGESAEDTEDDSGAIDAFEALKTFRKYG